MANEITDEQIMAAAYQHLPVWDQDHIRFARAVLALASHTGESEQCRTCGETQPHTGSCGTADSDTQALCKRTPPAATPAAPGEAEIDKVITAHGTGGWQTTDDMRKFARAILALSHPAPVAAPAIPDHLVKAFAKRGFRVPATPKAAMESAANIMLEDACILEHRANKAAPAPASEAVAILNIEKKSLLAPWPDANFSYCTPIKNLPVGTYKLYLAPTPGDSADAPVQQADQAYALKWCAAALQAVVAFHGERGSISMFVSGEKKSLEEVLDMADAALKGEHPVEPSGTERGEV